jgi:hypothetical protein
MAATMSSSDSDPDVPDEDHAEDNVLQQQESSSPVGGVSREIYVASGNEKKVLYLLCIGLNRRGDGNNEPLFSFELEPWSLLPRLSTMRPRNVEYVNEVVRRAKLFNTIPIPRPRNWNRVQAMEWLQHNPVCDQGDIEFLTNEVLRVNDIFIRRQENSKKCRLQWLVVEDVDTGEDLCLTFV